MADVLTNEEVRAWLAFEERREPCAMRVRIARALLAERESPTDSQMVATQTRMIAEARKERDAEMARRERAEAALDEERRLAKEAIKGGEALATTLAVEKRQECERAERAEAALVEARREADALARTLIARSEGGE